MARYIRYLEDGVWKYASIKDVGDLALLKTINKSDIVSAINEIYDNGGSGSGGDIPSDINDRLTWLEGRSEQLELDISKKADLEYVNGELVKKIDVDKYNTEYTQVKNDILSKVDSESYRLDYENITQDLAQKVDQSGFNELKGRVDTVETEVTQIEGEIATKISRTEFDDAVGVNQWIASKYVITGTDLNTIPPSFGLIKGMSASQVEEIDDSQSLLAFTDTGIIAHYFTNVKMEIGATVTLHITYDDSVAVYMNGAMMYENKFNGLVPVDVALPLRAGWNTIEILHGINGGSLAPKLDLGLMVSTSVDKMTTVIGVGDKNETRLTQAETEIKQNADSIELKASKLDVDNLGNRVESNEASIKVMNDEIASKVGKTEFNAYSQRLTEAESKITQNAESIIAKVDKVEHDNLNKKVESQGTEISQLSNQITLKVDSSTFDALKGRVDTAETQINLNKEQIALKASQSELDTLTGRVTTAEAELTVQAGQITSKVSQKEIDDTLNLFKLNEFEPLKSTVVEQGTEILQTKDAITQKANKTEVYTKLEMDGRISAIETDYNTKITQTADSIALKANSSEVYTKVDVDGKLGDKADNSTVNAVVERVTLAESAIEQNSKEIALRVTQQEVDSSVNKAVSDAKAEIQITTDGIKQEVSGISSTVTEQGKKFAEYDSSISTMKDEIKSKVSSTEVETIVGKIKIGGENLLPNSGFDNDLDGWSTTPTGSTTLDMDTGRVKGSSGIVTITADGGGFRTPMTANNTIIGEQEYTISFWIKASANATIGHTMIFKDSADVETSPLATSTKDITANVWTKFEETFIAPANAVAMATTPKVVSGFTANMNLWIDEVKIEEGNKATSWSPSSEEISETIEQLSVRVKNAEQIIEDDSIISKVTSSQSFQNALDEKANTADLADYATNDALQGEVDKINQSIDDKINGIDMSEFVKESELQQTTDSITAKFSASGGINLLKNSVGFAGFDFWTTVNGSGISTVSHETLDALGFGSGFYFMPNTVVKSITQIANVSIGSEYTLSWSVNKENVSTADGELVIEIQENDVVVASYTYASNESTSQYEPKSITYTASADKASIIVRGSKNINATVTGLMMNIGSIPLQWSMAHGEIYNSNIRMDMKGIKVSQIENDKETRFTVMTPTKFAGYYDVNGDGIIDDNENSADEVFRMNDDEFVMKKAVVKEEISLGSIKVIKIETSANSGWAFVPSK